MLSGNTVTFPFPSYQNNQFKPSLLSCFFYSHSKVTGKAGRQKLLGLHCTESTIIPSSELQLLANPYPSVAIKVIFMEALVPLFSQIPCPYSCDLSPCFADFFCVCLSAYEHGSKNFFP